MGFGGNSFPVLNDPPPPLPPRALYCIVKVCASAATKIYGKYNPKRGQPIIVIAPRGPRKNRILKQTPLRWIVNLVHVAHGPSDYRS